MIEVSHSESEYSFVILVVWAISQHQKNCRSDKNSFWLIQYDVKKLYTHAWSKISPTSTSLLSQRRQFGLNCKKIIALKIAYKIVAFFTENYPSLCLCVCVCVFGVLCCAARVGVINELVKNDENDAMSRWRSSSSSFLFVN